MLKHCLKEHEDMNENDVRMEWKVEKFFSKCTERMISEAVRIREEVKSGRNRLMNSKLEFNRSVLPDIRDLEIPDRERIEEENLERKIEARKAERKEAGRRALNEKKKAMKRVNHADENEKNPKRIALDDDNAKNTPGEATNNDTLDDTSDDPAQPNSTASASVSAATASTSATSSPGPGHSNLTTSTSAASTASNVLPSGKCPPNPEFQGMGPRAVHSNSGHIIKYNLNSNILIQHPSHMIPDADVVQHKLVVPQPGVVPKPVVIPKTGGVVPNNHTLVVPQPVVPQPGMELYKPGDAYGAVCGGVVPPKPYPMTTLEPGMESHKPGVAYGAVCGRVVPPKPDPVATMEPMEPRGGPTLTGVVPDSLQVVLPGKCPETLERNSQGKGPKASPSTSGHIMKHSIDIKLTQSSPEPVCGEVVPPDPVQPESQPGDTYGAVCGGVVPPKPDPIPPLEPMVVPQPGVELDKHGGAYGGVCGGVVPPKPTLMDPPVPERCGVLPREVVPPKAALMDPPGEVVPFKPPMTALMDPLSLSMVLEWCLTLLRALVLNMEEGWCCLSLPPWMEGWCCLRLPPWMPVRGWCQLNLWM